MLSRLSKWLLRDLIASLPVAPLVSTARPDTFSAWPHRWFMCDPPVEPASERFPLATDFVDPNWQCSNMPEIQNYISHGALLLVVMTFSCPYCEYLNGNGLRTDGVWLWWDDIGHLIETHDVRLPDAFVAHMVERRFEPAAMVQMTGDELRHNFDWPWEWPWLDRFHGDTVWTLKSKLDIPKKKPDPWLKRLF